MPAQCAHLHQIQVVADDVGATGGNRFPTTAFILAGNPEMRACLGLSRYAS